MKAPIEWFCWDYEDDQVRDALRMIEERRRLEQHNGYLLRLLCWMLAATWFVAILHSLWR
ncbi:MAG: hypothetical protein KatS3mg023_0576 [Armatimonadota bacterium]|jgi:hypothetical protein|nr:MAG: hypothetical protein KatS3mg023_0576 [Armatimonadota bacterium]